MVYDRWDMSPQIFISVTHTHLEHIFESYILFKYRKIKIHRYKLKNIYASVHFCLSK